MILKLLCWKSTSKNCSSSVHGIEEIITIQTSKFIFWGCFFTVDFFTPELMKFRWSSLFFGSFAPHFQIKLSTHDSNLNTILVITSELKVLLLTRVLFQNFNIVDLVKFLE
jgi:hypothetical protein